MRSKPSKNLRLIERVKSLTIRNHHLHPWVPVFSIPAYFKSLLSTFRKDELEAGILTDSIAIFGVLVFVLPVFQQLKDVAVQWQRTHDCSDSTVNLL
jgi:hypothetical protein